jgi:hypothetical protein
MIMAIYGVVLMVLIAIIGFLIYSNQKRLWSYMENRSYHISSIKEDISKIGEEIKAINAKLNTLETSRNSSST